MSGRKTDRLDRMRKMLMTENGILSGSLQGSWMCRRLPSEGI